MSTPSQRKYDLEHNARVDKYSGHIKRAYNNAIKEVSGLQYFASLNSSDALFLRNNPEVNKRVNTVLETLYTEVYGITIEGINSEWQYAVDKNNELTNWAFGKNLDQIPAEMKQELLSNNGAARRAFLARKDKNGLGLSDKIWKNTQQFKQELELGLEYGILNGQASNTMARSMQQYLTDPDMLFRRVRSKNGELRLSKAAKVYNPGRGKYRSSYKNALRLTRNEINFSYEQSQQEKRKQQPFIVAVEIRTSPQHRASDDKGGVSCISLQGIYPKEFDFSSKWHVNCKCMSLNVLKTREEMDADVDKILRGEEPNTESVNAVEVLPDNYTKYTKENADKWQNWANKPRFIAANKYLPTVPKPKPVTEVKIPEGKKVGIPKPKPFVFESAEKLQTELVKKYPDIKINIDADITKEIYNQGMEGFDVPTFIDNFEKNLKEYPGAFIKEIDLNYFAYNSEMGRRTELGFRMVGEYKKENIVLSRKFSIGKAAKTVEHSLFRLPEKMQGTGLSKKVFKDLYEQYKNAGIKEIKVHANLTVGGYTWGKYGFTQLADDVPLFIGDAFKGNEFFLAKEIFTAWKAQNRNVKYFPMNLFSENSKLKSQLLGSDWNGILDLTDPIQTKIFEDYIYGK